MGQDGLGGLEGLGLVGDDVVLHGLVVSRLARPHAGPQEERGPGVEAEQVHAVLRHLQLQRLGHGLQPRLGGRVHGAQRQPGVSWLVSGDWRMGGANTNYWLSVEQFVCPVDRCNCGSLSTLSSPCTVPGVGARRGQVDHSAAAGGAQLPEQLPGHQRGPGQVHLSKNLIIVFFFGKFAIIRLILQVNIEDYRNVGWKVLLPGSATGAWRVSAPPASPAPARPRCSPRSAAWTRAGRSAEVTFTLTTS